jgi:hypothetical protein
LETLADFQKLALLGGMCLSMLAPVAAKFVNFAPVRISLIPPVCVALGAG